MALKMANPGADGDPTNDPTQNPEKRAEIQSGRKMSMPTLKVSIKQN